MECLKSNRKRKQGGFTVIELLVALALFSMLAVGAFGAIVTASISARSAKSDAVAYSLMSTAFEIIAKDISLSSRVGCSSLVGTNCNSGNSLVLQTKDGLINYNFSAGVINRTNSELSYPLISNQLVVVEDFKIKVVGAGLGDQLQPIVMVTIKFRSLSGKVYLLSRSFVLEIIEL